MSSRSTGSKRFNVGDVNGQELRQLFPQLPDDVRRHIADKLSWTDRAKCLLLTKSGLEQHGIAVLFPELKEWHRLGQRLQRLKLPGHPERAAQTTQSPGQDSPSGQFSRQTGQPPQNALEEHVFKGQKCLHDLCNAMEDTEAERLLADILNMPKDLEMCMKPYCDIG